MKNIIMALTLLITFSSAYAESFVKEDCGRVSWSIEINKSSNGTIKIYRNSQSIKGIHQVTNDMHDVIYGLSLLTSLGHIATESTTFENTDERSSDTVSDVIKNKLISELSKLKVAVHNSELNLDNINCHEKGYLKKTLKCSALYKSTLLVDFK